jgi:hypothetical protein
MACVPGPIMPVQCTASYQRHCEATSVIVFMAVCCAGGGLRTISEAEAMKRYAEAVTRGGIPHASMVLEEVSPRSGQCKCEA